MRNFHRFLLVATLGIVMFLVAIGHAESEDTKREFKYNFSPSVFDGNDSDWIRPNLDFSATYKPVWGEGEPIDRDCVTLKAQLSADIEGALYWDKDLNLEPLSVNVAGGYSATTINLKNILDTTDYDFFLGLDAKFEADQAFNNINVIGEVQAAFRNSGKYLVGEWLRVPYLGVNLSMVEPAETEQREKFSGNTDVFPRMDAFIRWHFEIPEPLEELSATIHYKFVQEFDQSDEWKSRGFDQFDQFKVTIRYLLSGQKWYIPQFVFLRFTDGRLLGYVEDDTRLILGFEFF